MNIIPVLQNVIEASYWFQNLPLYIKNGYLNFFGKLSEEKQNKLVAFFNLQLQEEAKLKDKVVKFNNQLIEKTNFYKREMSKFDEENLKNSEQKQLDSLIASL